MSLDDFTLDFEEPGARPSGQSNMSAARPSASPTALPEIPATAPTSGPQDSQRPGTPPSGHESSAEHGSVRAWALALGVLLLLAAGSLFAVHRHHTARYAALNAAQSQLQSALEGADDLQAAELKALTERVAALRNELDNDVPADLQSQYQALVSQISALGSSSNQQLAQTAQALTASLTNQAGSGIALSGPNNTTIANTGVLSLNGQAGQLSLQGTPNQVDVIQNGSTTTLSTPQDIATTSSPSFAGLQVAGATTTNTLAIQSTGTQNGNQLCDSSNNCGYSGVSSSFVQGGNSFGAAAVLGTNDVNSLSLRTNGTNRVTIDTAGNTNLTGNLTTPGAVSAGSVSATTLSGNGSGLTNVNATALNGNTAGNSSGQIALNNSTLNTNLNADLLDGQHGSFFQNASNLNAGTVADGRLSTNVALQNAANSFTLQQNFAGGFLAINGTLSGTLAAASLIQGANAVCDVSNNCAYAANSGGAGYIQNQTAGPQTAGFNITGNGTIGGSLGVGITASAALLEVKAAASGQTLAILKSLNNIDILRVRDMGSDRAQILVGTYFSTANPNYSFANDPDTGIAGGFSADHIQLVTAGLARVTVNSSGNMLVGTTSGLGQLAVATTNAAQIGLVVRGAASQTGDLLQLQDSSGGLIASMTAAGRLAIGGTGQAVLQPQNTGALYLRASTSDVVIGDAGTNNVRVLTNGGTLTVGTSQSVTANNKLLVSTFTTADSLATALIATSGAANKGLVIQGASAQTGDLLQLQNSSGTVLSAIDNTGRLRIGSAGTNALVVLRSAATTSGVPTEGIGVIRLNRLVDDGGPNTNSTGAIEFGNNSIKVWRSENVLKIVSYDGLELSNTGTVNAKVFAVKGISGQVADLLQAQNSTGTVLASISAVGDLTVKSASVTGTLTVNGHIVTGNLSGSTSATPQAACGTGCTASVSGNDTSGTITITAGASGVTAGKQATIGFGSSFGTAPRVVLTPRGADAAGLSAYELDSSVSAFSIGVLNAPSPSTSYTFNYHVIQ